MASSIAMVSSDKLEAAADLSMPEPPADPLDRVGKAHACLAILCRGVRPTLGRLSNMLDNPSYG
jgi:hypothetical protein